MNMQTSKLQLPGTITMKKKKKDIIYTWPTGTVSPVKLTSCICDTAHYAAVYHYITNRPCQCDVKIVI